MIQNFGLRTEAHIRTWKIRDGVWIPHSYQIVPNGIVTTGDRWINDKIVTAAGGTASNPYTNPAGMILGNDGSATTKGMDWVQGLLSTLGTPVVSDGSDYQAFSSVVDDETNGRITWSASWSASQALSSNIQEVAIVPSGTETSSGKAVARFIFSPVDKSGGDTPLNITVHWTSNSPA